MRFTWDPKKYERVEVSHRIQFDKIKDVFLDPYAFEYTDEEHSSDTEVRFGIVGFTGEYGLVHLIFTEPEEGVIHFVTARKAENWITKLYDKERSRI